MRSDPVFQDWLAGKPLDPAERWPTWAPLIGSAVRRGVRVRRARIVSEPLSDYVRFEYEVTQGLNIAAGEDVRWLPRHRATGISLPAADYWLMDGQVLQLNHFTGDGESAGSQLVADERAVALARDSFEAVWERATPHAEYQPT